jgi:hypothetical protein
MEEFFRGKLMKQYNESDSSFFSLAGNDNDPNFGSLQGKFILFISS